ncbi:LysR family transcriptional regulator [Celeribacter indicus]|uniref:LysR family transcriptional regulator n=1 Tax=Celeribacter indicus TaxID=1208324 RepID=A0A0B5E060_9RHOB|nr:LysR family transcriptional regulator [Celeribacter indicus]AJE46775.1 LysR family transcriptional regulator [Celeribacter indicus]SDX06118.1 DNA-binding transcriptional regulator, LysR family [Celeribacter indicus]
MSTYNPGDMIMFAKVAECRSISAAARALNRPKASVSRSVSRLEDALGVRLIERSSRHLSLTEIGERFLVHCQQVALEISEAEAAVESMKGTVSGVLRVAVPLVFGRFVLAPILPRFMAAHPELRVNIKITDQTIHPIEEGFDMVIRASPLEDSSLISRLLGESFYAPYASPGYLARHAPITRPADLTDHNLLDYLNGAESRVMAFDREGEVERVEIRAHLDLNDAIIRRDAAIQGLGIAMLPDSTCRDAVAKGELVPVLPDWTMERAVRLYALWPSRRNLLPRLRIFVDFLATEVPVEMGNISEETGKVEFRGMP